MKDRLWMWLRDRQVLCDHETAIIDSFTLPIHHFAHAKQRQFFRGEAMYVWDHTRKQALYGFQVHARVCLPGMITRIYVTPGNVAEGEMVLDLTEGI